MRDPKDENYKDIVGINGDRKLLEPFHPTFTYPIFGDKEVIFGYKGLKVRVSHAPKLVAGGVLNLCSLSDRYGIR